jgi:sugar transferase (PEP-CTERM/EpsH1 system associated)
MHLLFLAHRAPFPPDRGDKIRSFHILRHLAARARVHLVAFADDPRDLEPPPALRARLASCSIVPRDRSRARAAIEAMATGRPVSLTAFADPRIQAAIDAVGPVAATYVFSGQMAQYRTPGRLIMDFVDLDSAKFAAYGAGSRGPVAWMHAREARLLGAFERRVAARADASLFVSAAEAALLPGGIAVENGIDTDHFDPAAVPFRPERALIVFTGQMDYRPNIDAVRWFVAEVMPRLPDDARFAIVGRAPTEAVRRLASERIEVTGEVADVRPWLARAGLVVAPLLLARGVQNKVLEAMAMARPVVATPAAAEGIDHAGILRIADGAEEFTSGINALLADPRSSPEARARVRQRYGWDARLEMLDALVGLAPAREAA